MSGVPGENDTHTEEGKQGTPPEHRLSAIECIQHGTDKMVVAFDEIAISGELSNDAWGALT